MFKCFALLATMRSCDSFGREMKTLIPIAVLGIAAASLGLSVAFAQAPAPAAQAPFAVPPYKNLKVLPKTTSREDLIGTMRRFSQSLGVRCTHCHVGEEGKPLSTFDFASDKKANKAIARDMLRLVHRLNTKDLPAIAGLESPQVTCYTCHRGAKEPAKAVPAS
jgi:hypothetical protein